jgi:hypothetical protein
MKHTKIHQRPFLSHLEASRHHALFPYAFSPSLGCILGDEWRRSDDQMEYPEQMARRPWVTDSDENLVECSCDFGGLKDAKVNRHHRWDSTGLSGIVVRDSIPFIGDRWPRHNGNAQRCASHGEEGLRLRSSAFGIARRGRAFTQSKRNGDSRPGNLGGFCVCRITLIRCFAGIGLLKIKLLHDPTI